MYVATTVAPARAAGARYPGSRKPLMSLPGTAPSANAASATSARVVSTPRGTSKRDRRAATVPAARSRSSSGGTSMTPTPPGRAPTSRTSAPSVTRVLSAGEEAVQVVAGAAVGEGVARPVQDPDDHRVLREVEPARAHPKEHGNGPTPPAADVPT